MNRNLMILGAGQYGTIAKEIAAAMGCFAKIDFLDDHNEVTVGRLSDYERFADDYSYVVVAIGEPALRLKWIQKLEEACYTVAILVHPLAYVSPSAQIQKGCIIEPNATIQANAALAIGVIVSAGAVVSHNSFVGDVCHVDCGAVVRSNSVVRARTKVASGTVFAGSNVTDENYFFEAGI
jgi:UDP-3-O-[3-hydroxymyristoyl] glucosamine N-acyltransferase